MIFKRIRAELLAVLAAYSRAVFYLKAELRDVRDTYLVRRKRRALTPRGFVLVGGNSQHHVAMQRGSFEPEETTLLIDSLSRTDVFVDVGANIGYYAAIARQAGKHVVCVEPLESNLDSMYATFAENNWSDIEIFPMGAGESPSIAFLYGASSTGASLLQHWAGASRIFRRTIPITTLDILLAERFDGRRLFIKIDVEGLEYRVLLGAKKVFDMEPKPRWLVEISLCEYHPEGMNPNYLQIFEMFWQHGYVAKTADARQKVICHADVEKWVKTGQSDSGVINYLFDVGTPEERAASSESAENRVRN